jgi:hypothetical protein
MRIRNQHGAHRQSLSERHDAKLFPKTLKHEEVNLCEYETYHNVVTMLSYFGEEVYTKTDYFRGLVTCHRIILGIGP